MRYCWLGDLRGASMAEQLSFSDAEQDIKRKKTRREVFLEEMGKVAPWGALEAVIEPYYLRAGALSESKADRIRHAGDGTGTGLIPGMAAGQGTHYKGAHGG